MHHIPGGCAPLVALPYHPPLRHSLIHPFRINDHMEGLPRWLSRKGIKSSMQFPPVICLILIPG